MMRIPETTVLDIGVIVPVVNRERTVLETLDTVAAQTCAPAQLVVVDDGSTDKTVAAVQDWMNRRRDSPTEYRLVTQPNGGAGAARNRGIRETADRQFLAFLDSDDLWPDDFLQRTHNALTADARAVAASTDCVKLDCGSGERRRKDYRILAQGSRATEVIFRSNHQGQATLFRAECVRDIGGFNVDLPTGQDLDFFLRLSLLGPWKHVPGAPIIYRLGYLAAQGEQPNLSRRFPDRFRKWTLIREGFLSSQPEANKWVRPEVAAHVMGGGWYKAACELQACGLQQDADDCFAKALKWRPSLKARYMLRKCWRALCGKTRPTDAV